MYSVYRGSSIITSIPGTTYTDTSLYPFCRYYYKVAAVNGTGTGSLSDPQVSTYTQPIPLAENVWYNQTATLNYTYSLIYYYNYYSFPVSAGTYFIQWAKKNHSEEGADYNVSAYWKSDNSMTNLTTTLFEYQSSGFANPRQVSVGKGYIILQVAYSYYSNRDRDCSIRFYK
jgi:hypothetical protein